MFIPSGFLVTYLQSNTVSAAYQIATGDFLRIILFAVTTDFLGFIFRVNYLRTKPAFMTILLIAVVLAGRSRFRAENLYVRPGKSESTSPTCTLVPPRNTRDLNGTKPSLIVGAFAEYSQRAEMARRPRRTCSIPWQGSTDKATCAVTHRPDTLSISFTSICTTSGQNVW